MSIRCRVEGANQDLYRIYCFRPGWTRKVKKGKPKTKPYGPIMKKVRDLIGVSQRIDVRSTQFGVNVDNLERFIIALGHQEEDLATTAIQHLLSLPDIINPHLDSRDKEKEERERRRRNLAILG